MQLQTKVHQSLVGVLFWWSQCLESLPFAFQRRKSRNERGGHCFFTLKSFPGKHRVVSAFSKPLYLKNFVGWMKFSLYFPVYYMRFI